jgi:hypothetical protein
MRKNYTNADKEYMIEKAIEIVTSLDGDYPSFKNYVWSVQHILKGGHPNNQIDNLVLAKLKNKGFL